jgi:hypothetical protein
MEFLGVKELLLQVQLIANRKTQLSQSVDVSTLQEAMITMLLKQTTMETIQKFTKKITK